MIINLKNLPNLQLTQLLRRRKVTLAQFLDERGISTSEELAAVCSNMGVAPPDEPTYTKAMSKLQKHVDHVSDVATLTLQPALQGCKGERALDVGFITPVVDVVFEEAKQEAKVWDVCVASGCNEDNVTTNDPNELTQEIMLPTKRRGKKKNHEQP